MVDGARLRRGKQEALLSAREVASKTQELKDRTKDFVLGSWDELPLWQQDNEYILSGYRPISGSIERSLRSLGHLHNETINIYSHLFGAALFLSLPLYAYYGIYVDFPTAGMKDIVVFSTFFYGVSICFLLSSTFHTINNHSERLQIIGNQLDYLGIIVLMWGSAIPSIYYGFYCDPYLQKTYWTMVSSIAAACAIATLHPKFRSPAWRPWRAGMYTGLGLSAILFVTHGLIMHGWETQRLRMAVDWMAATSILNIVGATSYAGRVPERWHPYTFDISGNSHQILHIMVIFAALTHMAGLMRSFIYIHESKQVC